MTASTSSKNQMQYLISRFKVMMHEQGQPVEDADYFYEDGDCIFQVEGVLFKLHKIMLSRESNSMFREMFKHARAKPECDDDVIEVIPLDDTVEEMRALCWILYALPTETHELLTCEEIAAEHDIRKLMRVLHVTDKYNLQSFGQWAWILLSAKPATIPTFLENCAAEDLEYAFRLADRCRENAPGLADVVESAWIRRIESGELAHAHALTVAESVGWLGRSFQGRIYLDLRKQLCHGAFVASLQRGLSHFGLSEAQLQRLLLGHAMLTNMMRVPGTHRPNVLVDCPHRGGCRSTWESLGWDQRDPLAFEAVARERAKSFPCIAAHLKTLEYPTKENIADFFLGPVATE
uniref:BTB domain-containing protein n=1 Tax=Mycena chlorophos TaxID=658473 RepID=A0ABQ0M8D1_MYCCL|nr:predicted protein [Mycena chlorophos]